MNRFTKILAASGFVAAFGGTAAFADALDPARAAGQVGERIDGMVGAVGSVSPDVAQTIASINAQRLATYRSIAQKTGTPIDAVQKQAGDHLIAATPAGQFVMDGAWHKK
ncbi:MAG: hypothetical protein JWM91_4253 [Rhodospirillales bacterium]|nr:hypothetical protein [Rhodospirillales bacterium]